MNSKFFLIIWYGLLWCIDILVNAENCCPSTNIIYLINWFCLNSYSMSNCNFCNKHSVVKRALMYILCLFQIQLSTSSGTHLIYILGTAIYEITLIHWICIIWLKCDKIYLLILLGIYHLYWNLAFWWNFRLFMVYIYSYNFWSNILR